MLGFEEMFNHNSVHTEYNKYFPPLSSLFATSRVRPRSTFPTLLFDRMSRALRTRIGTNRNHD